MELVSIFGTILRHRLLLAVGCVVSVAITVALAHHLSPKADTADTRGAASTRVLVDERRSLVSDLRRLGPLTIGTRAAILADLVSGTSATREIAARAGVPEADLGVISPAVGPPAVVGPLPDTAAQAQEAMVRGHRDLVQVEQEPTLPVLHVEAEAADQPTARRLVLATIDALSAQLDARRVGRRPGVVVRPLGTVAVYRVEVGGAAHPILAFIAGLFVLASWCAGIVVASGVARSARRVLRRAQEAPVATR